MADALAIRDLHVHYGASHAVQGVSLTLTEGVHAVLGRNGMGKTTLCNAIMGLKAATSGSIRFRGRELTGLPPHRIAALGVGYTPQGRRLWPSLTVHDHLRLCEKRGGRWSVERVYAQFPRLAERRGNGGAQLSGGEQQMLAIARALLADPDLLILDEPTEGLAPVIVGQVVDLLQRLAAEGDVAILLVEQNLRVATECAEDVAIMVGGRIDRILPAAELAADRALQQRLLGVGRVDEAAPAPVRAAKPAPAPAPEADPATDLAVRTARHAGWAYVAPDRWSADRWTGAPAASPPADVTPLVRHDAAPREDRRGAVLVAGTYDTKGRELGFLRDRLRAAGVAARSVDLSTSGKPSSADVPPHLVAAHHPRGAGGVFTGDRGTAVAAMTLAFERWTRAQDGIGGIITAAGSGGTALAAPAMRALPVGVPKLIVSTVASGDVSAYVGPSDVTMMHSVTDVAGLNRISRRVLGNAADAMIGMARGTPDAGGQDRPLLGLTMFGVTTPLVERVSDLVAGEWEPLVFHATGTGGRAMELLAENGLLAAAMDLTTTEVADMIAGGVMAAEETRFDAFARAGIPWIGSVGALDMVNFGARATVPERYAHRVFYEHNPQVTLMRTTPEECAAAGRFIARKANAMTGPVRLLLPEGGLSALDAPGKPFEDRAAREALFGAIEDGFAPGPNRALERLPHHVNDPAFAEAARAALEDAAPRRTRHAAI